MSVVTVLVNRDYALEGHYVLSSSSKDIIE